MAAFITHEPAGVSVRLAVALLAWGAVVTWASIVGPLPALAMASPPALGLLIGLTVIIPTVLYFQVAAVRRSLNRLGLRMVTLFNLPRIPGGMLIAAFGVMGYLPLVFGIVAGIGDVISGIAAARIIGRDVTAAQLRVIHAIGLADIGIALSSGMFFALRGDPLMAGLATPTMALIVLWYVGMLSTTHIVVLARLANPARPA